mmetsp:Transcript_119330/g.210986  ORF Transcript_119330/g.210986 Transcript_119330/m.210986 type:complete len:315 (-) Transcript_119330:166-1110(-)
MPSPSNVVHSGLHSTSKARHCKFSERHDGADAEFDFNINGSEGFFGLRQRRIIRIMSVIQLCLILGFAHVAMYKQARVQPLTEESLPSFIAGHPEGTLVNFHIAGCSHCVKLAPEVEAAARELSSMSKGSIGSQAVLASVDAMISPKAARRYGVTQFPSMLWFRNGLLIRELPPNARSAKQIVDFVTWASGSAVVEFNTRAELDESLPELRAALPLGGPPVIVGFSSVLANAGVGDKPAVARQDVYDVLEVVAERLRGETVFLYIQQSWDHDPSFRAYFRDAAADRDYNETLTADSVQAWVQGLLTKKPKKWSS